MLKFFGGILMGAFVGALVVEVIRRQRPQLLEEVERQAKRVSDKLFGTAGEAYGQAPAAAPHPRD